ncbi:unnamed protein product [Oikopleura dioica]|uniref:Uncharacterized protein n=1 Tax=Oikopleura dioica TaxID=34765 RepID=E4XP12_OIKDI|nr:unnamed protein product [Oikopleura dioica]
MFILSKKQFLKLIKAPLRVKSTDKKSKFRGLSEQKIRELLEDKEEWVKMTKSIQGRYKIAVISYLTGIIHYQPELVFQEFWKGAELVENKVQIKRKLQNWLRSENFKFTEESSVAFEEKVAEREARTGLSQALIDAHLDDEDTFHPTPEINEESLLEELDDAEESVAEVFIDDEGVEKEGLVDVAVVEEVEIEEENSDEDCSVLNIFDQSGKLPIDPKGGRRTTWSCKFIQQSVELLASGETAASCFNFFSSMAKHYPELLGEGKMVPSITWFQRLRDGLPFLNAEHTRDVILKGNKFFLATDGAAMLDASKSMAVGVLNEEGRLHLLNIKKSQGGTGEEVAAQMLECIEETGVGRILKDKIELLMSDQEAAQLKANGIVAAQLTSEDNEEAPKTLTCAMHSVANCCSNSRKALEEVCPDAATLLDDIKCVYAKPKKGGYCQQDGRKDLLLLLRELDDCKKRIFTHDLGKRFGNDSRNSGALVLNFKTVMKVTKLEMHKYDDKKKNAEQESKFHRINKLCSGQQDGVLLDASTLFLNYASHLNVFHKRISKVGDDALTLQQLRDLFRSTLLRMQQVLDSKDPYSQLIDGAKLMSQSEESRFVVVGDH